MSYVGFLWLVWALLFLKENFSFFPPISSSLFQRDQNENQEERDTDRASLSKVSHHSKEHPW